MASRTKSQTVTGKPPPHPWFILRHGYVKYTAVRQYPRPMSCEVCLTGNDGRKYQWDHCHVHGWVRGTLCAPCNLTLGRAERGIEPWASSLHWRAHRFKCPDCLNGVPAPPPKPPKPPKPRRVKCPACGGTGWVPAEEIVP